MTGVFEEKLRAIAADFSKPLTAHAADLGVTAWKLRAMMAALNIKRGRRDYRAAWPSEAELRAIAADLSKTLEQHAADLGVSRGALSLYFATYDISRSRPPREGRLLTEAEWRRAWLSPLTYEQIAAKYGLNPRAVASRYRRQGYPSRKSASGVAREAARRLLNPVDEALFIELCQSGASSYDLARRFKMCRATVNRWCKRLGVMKPRDLRRARFEERDAIIREMYRAGVNLSEICEKFGLGLGGISALAERKKFPRRPRGVRLTLREFEEIKLAERMAAQVKRETDEQWRAEVARREAIKKFNREEGAHHAGQ